jgi:hypothetical protein
MPIIVRDVLESMAPYAGVNGTCADNEAEIIDYLNKVCKLLHVRGDWKGTIEEGCIATTDCTFALPWHLAHVRNAWYCNQSILLRDQYYETFAGVGIQTCCGGCCFPQLIQTGKTMPYQKPVPNGWRLAIQGTAIEDVEMQFQMMDYTGQRYIQSITPNMDVQKLDITLGQLMSVTKPRTKGFVRAFAWHPDHSDMEFVAKYDAHQEAPQFTEYKLTGTNKGEIKGEKHPQLILRAKKQYIPIREVTDVLWLESEAALEFGALALNAKISKNNELYVQNLNLAEEQLEEVLENEQPKSWTPLQVRYQPQAMSPQVTGRMRYRNIRRFGL